MAKKHHQDGKRMGPELYSDENALPLCSTKTVVPALILMAHSPRNVSTYPCALLPPHIHGGLLAALPRAQISCFVVTKPLCITHFLVGL